jgi:hypothetical protein
MINIIYHLYIHHANTFYVVIYYHLYPFTYIYVPNVTRGSPIFIYTSHLHG